MPATPQKTRIPEIDVLRGFAIAAVVGIHVSWFYVEKSDLGTTTGGALALLHLLNGFGVPFFLAMSTAALSLHLPTTYGPRDHFWFLFRRALSLLPAYVTWSLVSAALYRPDVFISLRKVIRMLVVGYADGQYYFIPLLFEIYLIWPLFRPLVRWSQRGVGASASVAAAGMLASFAWWVMSAKGIVVGEIRNPMFWIGYSLVGVAFASSIPSMRRAARSNLMLAGTATATAAAAWMMYRNFFNLIPPPYGIGSGVWAANIFQVPPALYTLLLMSLLTMIACRWNAREASTALLTTLSRHSYGTFLVHLIVIKVVLLPLLPPEGITDLPIVVAVAKVLFCWAAALALSTGLVAMFSATRWTRPLVSNHR